MTMSRRGMASVSERKPIRASLAAPSTGGAARRTRIAAPRMPSTRLRGDRGMTRMSSSAASARGFAFFATRVGLPLAARLIGLPRPVQQDLVVAANLILIPDELEGAVERLDARFEHPFGIASAQLQLVDVVV